VLGSTRWTYRGDILEKDICVSMIFYVYPVYELGLYIDLDRKIRWDYREGYLCQKDNKTMLLSYSQY